MNNLIKLFIIRNLKTIQKCKTSVFLILVACLIFRKWFTSVVVPSFSTNFETPKRKFTVKKTTF